jgi:hypothetical protein
MPGGVYWIRLTGGSTSDVPLAISSPEPIGTIPNKPSHLLMLSRSYREKGGRPRCRPGCLLGDRGYDVEAIRQGLRMRGISSRLAKRNTEHGGGLGRYGWVVERTFCVAQSISSPAYSQ